jgi:hypothetical protein
MDRIGATGLCDLKDAITSQVRFDRGCRPQPIRLICMKHVQTAAVCIGVDRDWRNTKLAAGAKDAQCDLTAIGNQDLAKGSHQSRILTAGSLAALTRRSKLQKET